MNTPSKSILLSIVALLVATAADAMPPTGRVVEGVLRQVNPQQHSASIATGDATKPITWTPRTRVFQDGSEVNASALRDGMRVKVTRHVPIFGPPFVRRVILLDSSSK